MLVSDCSALSEEECDQLTWLLTMPREAAGDFSVELLAQSDASSSPSLAARRSRGKNAAAPSLRTAERAFPTLAASALALITRAS